MGTWDDLMAGKRRAYAMRKPEKARVVNNLGLEGYAPHTPRKTDTPRKHERRVWSLDASDHGLTKEQQAKVKALFQKREALRKELNKLHADGIAQELKLRREQVRAYCKLLEGSKV